MAEDIIYSVDNLAEGIADINSVSPLNPGSHGLITNPTFYAGNARHVPGRGLFFLLQAPPLMVRYAKNPDYEIGVLKALIETRATSITGINFGNLTSEFSETKYGEQEMLETHRRITEERSVPAMIWDEQYRRAVWRYWYNYKLMYLADPNTQVPGILYTEGYMNEANPLMPIEFNQSFTMLAIEPTPDLREPVGACLISNMMPKAINGTSIERVSQERQETATVEIEFTGMSDRRPAVYELASLMLENLAKENMNTLTLPTFLSDIDSDVDSLSNGIKEMLVR